MSMITCGAYAETVTRDFVNAKCPKEYQDFIDILKTNDIDFASFCDFLYNDNEFDGVEEETITEIMKVYSLLCDKFEEVTGLELEVTYHDAEDRGDELDGGSFCLDGVYEMTPAAKKIKDDITRKWWTTFG